jgi:serine/threonine protein kinase
MVVGTFQYMAPEQVEGQRSRRRSDIFALGTVLYEMLTGNGARFEGKTTASTIAAILAADPPPIASVQPLSPLSARSHGEELSDERSGRATANRRTM